MLITEQLIFITLFFVFMGFFIYVHVAYPFWSHMPVMHTPYCWLQNLLNTDDTLIEKIPYRNKYVHTLLFTTFDTHSINAPEIKTVFTDTLHCYYLPSDTTLFTMDVAKFDAIFSGHTHAPLITVGQQCCVASLPLTVGKQNIYSISYLACSNKDTTRKLLSTHIFNSRRKNPLLQRYLYKTYSPCIGAKPLIQFNTGLYYLGKKSDNIVLPVQQITKNNWSFVYPVIDAINAEHKFAAWIAPAALKARSDAGIMWIFAWIDATTGTVLAAYILEDAMTLYENLEYGKLTMNLCGSYKCGALSDKEFCKGLLKCIQIVQKQNLDYVMLTVDDVGFNAILARSLSGSLLKTTAGEYCLINQYFSEEINKGGVFIVS